MINYSEENDLSEFSNFSFIDFFKNNIIQLLLLLLVFVIIFVVEKITFFNNMFLHIQQKKVLKNVKRI
jgi:hypothetical protein